MPIVIISTCVIGQSSVSRALFNQNKKISWCWQRARRV